MSRDQARAPDRGQLIGQQHLQVTHRCLLEVIAAGVAIEPALAARGSCR